MSKPRFFMGPAGAATDKRLNMTDLRVLCILGTFTNNKGWCFPLQETLAGLLDRSRPVVNASLKRLEDCGYIESKKRKGGANRKLYRVILDVKEDSHDLPDGLFEVEGDVCPTDISTEAEPPKPTDVRPADMSAPRTCLPGKHVSQEVSVPPTGDVGPTDTQRELEPLNQTDKAAKAAPARVKPHYLPEAWDPKDDEVRLAESLNFTRQQFDDCLRDFRAYWLGEAERKVKSARKADWDITFRNRIRAVAGYWKTQRQAKSNLSAPVVPLSWADRLYAFEAFGQWNAEWGPKPGEPGCRVPQAQREDLFA